MTSARLPHQQAPATRRLRVLVGVCAIVFTIGTALHNFAVIDSGFVEELMRRGGQADPSGAAAGFTAGFRLVGTAYILLNAAGVLAFWSRAAWLWWTVIAVNVTQACGWFMIPPDMWTLAVERYGPLGVVPAAVTDGGAALLVLVLAAVFVRRPRPWGRERVPAGSAMGEDR